MSQAAYPEYTVPAFQRDSAAVNALLEQMRRLAAFFLKLRRLLGCDLLWRDRAAYLFDEGWDRLIGVARTGVRRYRLRGGGAVLLRHGSTDRRVFDEVFLEKIYAPGIARFAAGGAPTILVDLGANIGLSTVFLARRLKLTRIVAVEPSPDNFRLLLENTQDLAGRCTALNAFAGAERGFAHLVDAGFGAWGLRMGAASSYGTPVLPLAEILPAAPGARILLKCDIEGSERHLFRNIRDWEHLVDFILLELHTEFFTAAELEHCLEESGYDWVRYGAVKPGAVLAILTLQRTHRKSVARYNQLNDSRDSSRGAAAM